MKYAIALASIVVLAFAIIPSARRSPMVLAGCKVISSIDFDVVGDGKLETVEILLTGGRRYVDEMPWCGMGDKWEGEFAVRVRSGERILSLVSVNELMGVESLFFHAPHFELVLQDYNHDGLIDFNLGQYSGCNGGIYYLFTILADGQITRLGHKGYHVFDHRNSTPTIQVADDHVGFTYYSQSSALYETEWYEWHGDDFAWIETTFSTSPP